MTRNVRLVWPCSCCVILIRKKDLFIEIQITCSLGVIIHRVTLLSEPDILDAREMESELDDSDEEEVETLEELEDVLECFEWVSSVVLTSPHSLRCLIWVICLSSLAILKFWSLITFLTSDSFLSDNTFRMGPVVSKQKIQFMIHYYEGYSDYRIHNPLGNISRYEINHITSIRWLWCLHNFMHLCILDVKLFSHCGYFLF